MRLCEPQLRRLRHELQPHEPHAVPHDRVPQQLHHVLPYRAQSASSNAAQQLRQPRGRQHRAQREQQHAKSPVELPPQQLHHEPNEPHYELYQQERHHAKRKIGLHLQLRVFRRESQRYEPQSSAYELRVKTANFHRRQCFRALNCRSHGPAGDQFARCFYHDRGTAYALRQRHVRNRIAPDTKTFASVSHAAATARRRDDP